VGGDGDESVGVVSLAGGEGGEGMSAIPDAKAFEVAEPLEVQRLHSENERLKKKVRKLQGSVR
jgi:hypothetical protein